MLEITKELETGIAIIDQQHRELVDRINTLISLGDKAKNPKELGKTLTFLGEYVLVHFRAEEDLMTGCVYPACYLHEGQHRLFVDKFLEFKRSFEEEGYSDSLSVELNGFLVSWVINHIKVSDADFGKYYLDQLEKTKI